MLSPDTQQVPPMDTVVLQSFRTHDVPRWLARCLQSVRSWARREGWAYEFLDDQFFAFAPEWARKRCEGNIYALTDICRLQWMRDRLDAGCQRVIWADADVLVFAPSRLDVRTARGHAFAHELFLRLRPDGTASPLEGMNNALMVFEQGQRVLDAYLATSLDHLSTLPAGVVPRTALGPQLLAALDREQGLDRLNGVGLFTLALMREIAVGGGPLTRQCVRLSPAPLGAANLCHFMRNATPLESRPAFDAVYDTAVERLLVSAEDVLRESRTERGSRTR
jgi:hypothetical protein